MFKYFMTFLTGFLLLTSTPSLSKEENFKQSFIKQWKQITVPFCQCVIMFNIIHRLSFDPDSLILDSKRKFIEFLIATGLAGAAITSGIILWEKYIDHKEESNKSINC